MGANATHFNISQCMFWPEDPCLPPNCTAVTHNETTWNGPHDNGIVYTWNGTHGSNETCFPAYDAAGIENSGIVYATVMACIIIPIFYCCCCCSVMFSNGNRERDLPFQWERRGWKDDLEKFFILIQAYIISSSLFSPAVPWGSGGSAGYLVSVLRFGAFPFETIFPGTSQDELTLLTFYVFAGIIVVSVCCGVP